MDILIWVQSNVKLNHSQCWSGSGIFWPTSCRHPSWDEFAAAPDARTSWGHSRIYDTWYFTSRCASSQSWASRILDSTLSIVPFHHFPTLECGRGCRRSCKCSTCGIRSPSFQNGIHLPQCNIFPTWLWDHLLETKLLFSKAADFELESDWPAKSYLHRCLIGSNRPIF